MAKIKAHSLTGRITQPVMLEAFRNVKRNRGAAGIDKVSIKLYENNLLENLLALMRRLKDGTFRPLPLRRVYIPKGDGQTRPLGEFIDLVLASSPEQPTLTSRMR